MMLDFLWVVFGTSLLGLRAIGGSVRNSHLASIKFLACVGLGLSFLTGVGFHFWNRSKTRNVPLQVGSKLQPALISPLQAERVVLPPNPKMTVKLSYFAGTWKNVNPTKRGITKVHVRTEGQSVWVRAWEKCHPTDCDWGEASGAAVTSTPSASPESDIRKVTAMFQTSFSDTTMTLTPVDESTIEADTQTRFTDNSGRSGYSATYTFRH